METSIKNYNILDVNHFLLQENIIDVDRVLHSVVEEAEENIEEVFSKFSNPDINPSHSRPIIKPCGPTIKLNEKPQSGYIDYDLSIFSLHIYDKDPYELQELVDTELLVYVSTRIVFRKDILIVPVKHGTQWFVEVDEKIDMSSIAYQPVPMYYKSFLSYLEKLSDNDMLIGVSLKTPDHWRV